MILMTEISHAHLDQSNLPSLSSGKEKKTVILYEAQLLLIVQISATLHRSRRGSTHTLTCYLFNTHYNNLTSQWPKLSPEHKGESQPNVKRMVTSDFCNYKLVYATMDWDREGS